jgi:S-methylmethionine-dependent homocysteine/selenocysteine methylase
MTTEQRIKELIVFDGGTGREIERRGGPFRQPEWSALALYEDPAIVRSVHESYLEAGATAITTNSYAIVPFHLGQERYEKDSKRLLDLSVDLACEARGERNDVSVIGCIPPICGSYEPEKFDEKVAGPILKDFLRAYQDRVDLLLVETIGSIAEARFYLETIRDEQTNWKKRVPTWISFCIASDYGLIHSPRLLSGGTLKDAIDQLTTDSLLGVETVPVVLVNCCDVKLVDDAIKQLVEVLPGSFRVGAYPNAFSIPPPDAANHTLRQVDYNMSPGALKTQAEQWIQSGASVLGGCCGVGPDHIRSIASLR